MMLDPLSSLAIAAAVVQFADAITKLFSTTREIHLAGFTKGNEDLGIVVKDILDVYEQLKRDAQLGPLSKPCDEDENLLRIVDSCISIGNDLQSRLHKLNPSYTTARRRFDRSFRQALRVLWHQNEIRDLQKRLEIYRRQADSHILTSLHNIKIQEKKERAQAIEELSQDHKKLITQLNRQHGDIISKFKVIDQELGLQGEKLREYVEIQMKEIHRLLQNPTNTLFPPNSMSLPRQAITGEFINEKLNAATRARHISNVIIESLYHQRSNERMRTVARNHRDTFQWIFRPDNHQRFSTYSNGNFSRWLKTASGCFWISGKPGSGKSTLMRFICTSPATVNALCEWADGSNLVISSFFFWRAGTDLQKLLIGMLRAVLHDILLVYPELTKAAFPELTAHLEKHLRSTHVDFTFNDLREALQTLASISQSGMSEIAPFKVFLFIDGIDESSEDSAGIAQLLRDVTSNSSVAALVSGRPDQGCEAMFDDAPRLRVQDLTKPDIQKYLTDNFEENAVVKRLDEDEKSEIQHLIHQIIDQADGVFLWVELVVKSLLQGIRDGDTVQDLHERFAELPKDLQKLYEHMLSEVNPRYRQEACQFFVIYREMTKRFASVYLTPLSLRVLNLSTDKYNSWISDDWSNTNIPKFHALAQKMEARIQSRSRGLIEVRRDTNELLLSPKPPSVQLLHRSLAEFLFEPSQWTRIEEYANLSGGDLDKQLSRMLLIQTKEMLGCQMVYAAQIYASALVVHARRVEPCQISHDPHVTAQLINMIMHEDQLDPRKDISESPPQSLNVSDLSAALGFCETTLAFTEGVGNWTVIAELLSWMTYAQKACKGTLQDIRLRVPVPQRFLERQLRPDLLSADFNAYARACWSMLNCQTSVSKTDLEISWNIAVSGYLISGCNAIWDDVIVALVNFGPNLFTGIQYNTLKPQYVYEILPERMHSRFKPKVWEKVKSIRQDEEDWQIIEASDTNPLPKPTSKSVLVNPAAAAAAQLLSLLELVPFLAD